VVAHKGHRDFVVCNFIRDCGHVHPVFFFFVLLRCGIYQHLRSIVLCAHSCLLSYHTLLLCFSRNWSDYSQGAAFDLHLLRWESALQLNIGKSIVSAWTELGKSAAKVRTTVASVTSLWIVV
jgi:hypothetical protein